MDQCMDCKQYYAPQIGHYCPTPKPDLSKEVEALKKRIEELEREK